MAYTPVEITGFGGLDLRLDAQHVPVNSAVDMLNVRVGHDGSLLPRDALRSLVTLGSGTVSSLTAWTTAASSYDTLLITNGTNLYAYAGDATLLGSSAYTGIVASFASLGTAANVGYFSNTSGVMRKVTATGTVSVPAGLPTGRWLTVQNPDNRLVAVSTAGGGCRVQFSDPGAPETFGASNYIDLEPYDGDQATGVVSWNNMVFVFKARKLYVFYGNSVDGSGNPVFNFRRVSANVGTTGISATGGSSAVAAVDGVYFVAHDGVYRTTGGPPERISTAIDAVFAGESAELNGKYFGGYTGVSGLTGVIAVVNDRIYFQVGNSSTLFVYDIPTRMWMYWDLHNVSFIATATVSDIGVKANRLVTASSVDNKICLATPKTTTDYGNDFACRWRSGFWNPGAPGAEAVVREWLIDGAGDLVTFQTAVNDGITMGSAASVPLGSWPARAQGRDRRAVRGRNVSFQVNSTSGGWAIDRIVANMRGQRNPGLKAT